MNRLLRSHPVASFFVLAWLFSWVIMVPLALAKHGLIHPLSGWWHYLSAYGPMLAAIVVSRPGEGPAGIRAWWARLAAWRADGWTWAMALSPALLYLVAATAQRTAQGTWPAVHLLGRVNFLPDLGPWAIVLWLLNSGLGEESGWRGFALPMLQRRYSPRVSSLAIAGAWMIWHIPAFFYLPSYEHLGPGMVVGFFVGILTGTFLLTWLSNRSHGVLLPIVWHALFNFTTAPPSSVGMVSAVISTAITLLGIVAAWRLRRPQRTEGRTR